MELCKVDCELWESGGAKTRNARFLVIFLTYLYPVSRTNRTSHHRIDIRIIVPYHPTGAV